MLIRLLAALGGLLLGGLALRGWPLNWLTPLHLITALIAGIGWRIDGELLAVRAVIVSLCMPVVGPIGLWIVHRPPRAHSDLVQNYKDYIAYLEYRPATKLVDPDERLRQELSVQPLADVLHHGDFAAKQTAAEALAKQGTAHAIEQLRAALRAPERETRMSASLALVKAEANATVRMADLRERCRKHHAAPADWLDLATVAADYARSGLPSRELALSVWEDSDRAAQQILASASDAPLRLEAHRLRAEALLKLGRAEDAVAAAEVGLQQAPEDVALLMLAAAGWFALGQFDRIPALARTWSPLAEPESDAADIAAYWTAHER